MNSSPFCRFSTWGTLVVSVQFFLLLFTSAQSASSLEGTWSQTYSNAGECSNCTILIEPVSRRNGMLLVTATNGWAAQLFYDLNADGVAGGVGRWHTNHTGAISAKVFDMVIQTIPAGLEMRMRARDDDKGDWVVSTFNRASALSLFESQTALSMLPSVTEQIAIDPVSEPLLFACRNGKTLLVQYDHRAAESIAVASYDARQIYMIQVISGSGTRYANDEYEFHTKGKDGVFTVADQTIVCDLE
ncbi:MAG: MliC family protein [Hyphomicrobiales bacterium]